VHERDVSAIPDPRAVARHEPTSAAQPEGCRCRPSVGVVDPRDDARPAGSTWGRVTGAVPWPSCAG